MKAMILAAGLGTRLRPLTDDRPKALVEVNGRTLLEITLTRLRQFGVQAAIINVHHFADMVVPYLQANNNFGMRIEISREDELLDTGGGLKKAAWFFLEDADTNQPFILHNVDVISTIDLARMIEAHRQTSALATLAVQNRETSRYLLFDDQGQLCGRRKGRDQAPQLVHPAHSLDRSAGFPPAIGEANGPTPTSMPEALAFSGIHIISPRLLSLMTETGPFSIIDTYSRLAAGGEKIHAFRADQYYWRDLGKAESIAQAVLDLRNNLFS